MLELAEHLKSDRSYVARRLSLVNLAPDIITAVMSGKAPGTLTLTKVLESLLTNLQWLAEKTPNLTFLMFLIICYSIVQLYIKFDLSRKFRKPAE